MSCPEATTITGVRHVRLAAPPGVEEGPRAFHGGLLGHPAGNRLEFLEPSG
ncbi:hypothetical protein ACQEU6_21775 [Spirillospora sp. CA-108201]